MTIFGVRSNYGRIPIQKLRKSELRLLIAETRMRHLREVEALIASLPPDVAMRLPSRLGMWKQ